MDREAAVRKIKGVAPDALAARLVASLRPSLRVTSEPADADILLGQSRLGGWPDVPDDFAWPTAGAPMHDSPKPLTLLAQINLAELPADVDLGLPSSGCLLFFLDADDGFFEHMDDFEPRDRWRVLFIDCPTDDLAEMPRPGDDPDNRPAVRAIRFTPEWNVDEKLRYGSADESSGFHQAREALIGSWGERHHRLLGHAQPIQGNLEFNAEMTFRRPGPDASPLTDDEMAAAEPTWRLLLQVDSDDDLGWHWGDAGRIHFMIREPDLIRRDFGSVIFEEQGH